MLLTTRMSLGLKQFLILRTVEVLADLLIDEDDINAEVLKRDNLSVFTLILRRHPPVNVSHDFSSNLSGVELPMTGEKEKALMRNRDYDLISLTCYFVSLLRVVGKLEIIM